MTDRELILASASPRRYAIVYRIEPRVRVVEPFCEEVHWNDRPEDTVRENALRKNMAVRRIHPDAWLIAADTVVCHAGRVLGKPASLDEARGMLRSFSGTSQTVFSGVALAAPSQPVEVFVDRADVWFKPLNETAIEAYLAEVNPLDKAGGYDIGSRGEQLIERYEGALSTIMGLCADRISAWLGSSGWWNAQAAGPL
jgi:septum formation protein